MKMTNKVKSKGTPKAGNTVGVSGDNFGKKATSYVDKAMLKGVTKTEWDKPYPNNKGGTVKTNMLNVPSVSVNGDNFAK